MFIIVHMAYFKNTNDSNHKDIAEQFPIAVGLHLVFEQ